MSRIVLVPCACGQIHRLPDPGRALQLRCTETDEEVRYECAEGDHFRLRGYDRDIVLDREALEIGRRADVSINLPSLSRRHCVLMKSHGGYEIRDLESRNGTFVNEERLAPGLPRRLQGGDLVRLGDQFFRYLVPRGTQASVRDEAFETAYLASQGLEAVSESVEDRMVGRLVGRYRILSVMAQGGMGRVYRAENVDNQLACVVKTIIPRDPDNLDDHERVERFLHEMAVCMDIRHPNIVEFFDVGQVGPFLYIAMEYFAGKDLRDRFHGRPADPETVVRVGRQTAAALAAAHALDVIHRDIKPENILLDDEGVAMVVDFGIAKMRESTGGSTVTASGSIVGTLRYMAPEQLQAERDLTPAIDVYALGAVLYFCLTGQDPYRERTVEEMIKAIRVGPRPVSALRPEVPLGLETVVMRALATDPATRYPNAEALLGALESL